MSTQVLHMRLGETFGILLAQVAQEHIMYNYDVKKGVETITEGLHGIPLDMALKVIKGEYVIEVCEGGEEVNVNTERNESHKDYPIFNVAEWSVKKCKEIFDNGEEMKDILDLVSRKFRYRSTVYIHIPVSNLKSLFSGNLDGDEALKLLFENEIISRAYEGAMLAKKYIETSFKLFTTIKDLSKIYHNQLTDVEKNDIEYELGEALLMIDSVKKIVSDMVNCDFEEARATAELTNYLNATREIDRTLEEGIKPVDIMDNYSAGWLSPEGLYYALNGEIANMLHNQIADALQEIGIIPEEAGSPDAWLEQQGWVKIHGNNVHFAGNLNNKIGLPNVQMTDKQIQLIFDYIQNCHQSEIKLGWRLTRLSAGMFFAVSRDRIAMNKQYFDFD